MWHMENGKINKLQILATSQAGYNLKDDKGEEIFLPIDQIEESQEVGTSIDVFVYKDKTRMATTKLPLAQVEQFAFLNVKYLTEAGAYVDWGLDTELFVPKEEQMEELKVDESYLIFVFENEETGVIRGSQRVEDFVFHEKIEVVRGDEVSLLLYRESQLGINAVINNPAFSDQNFTVRLLSKVPRPFFEIFDKFVCRYWRTEQVSLNRITLMKA